jgi:uncharacterized membrane protein YhaH (DUF805 family)
MRDQSFVRRMIAPVGRLLEFDGRSTRAEHWPYMGLLIAIYVIGVVLAVPAGPGAMISAMYVLTLILVLLASASVVRRLHDVGWSGRWMAAYVVMSGIGLLVFVVTVLESTSGPNRYDADARVVA